MSIFSKFWETGPLLIQGRSSDYYAGLFSTAQFYSTLRENDIQYSVNLDVTTYKDEKRETHNPSGRAYAPIVWDFYKDGCSLRMLNPQTYSVELWKLNSLLQEKFGTFVGANSYLTPPNSQGFAPHWDDIEAFILQIEGKKQWKVYEPRNKDERLPRFSSPNFAQNEIGKPVMDVVLNPGDLLYLPRGYIHQAVTVNDEHSLHLTISTTQQNTWGDLLQKLLPQALEIAMAENVAFRKSLPVNYMQFMGVVHSDKSSVERESFNKTVTDMVKSLCTYAPVEAAVDQMAKDFQHRALPPCLSDDEMKRSVQGAKTECVSADHQNKYTSRDLTLESGTEVKLLRKNCIRLVVEGDNEAFVYHSTENTRVYEEKEPMFFKLPLLEMAAGVEYLIDCYPNYVKVSDVPLDSKRQKVTLCKLLFGKLLLLVKK